MRLSCVQTELSVVSNELFPTNKNRERVISAPMNSTKGTLRELASSFLISIPVSMERVNRMIEL